MFRAQAVLLASACLALAPAAFAETSHHASHKPHAKGHAEEAPSKKAKPGRAAEADPAPQEGRKAHAEKASSTGKHHPAADGETDAAPSKSSGRHKTAAKTSHADEEADAAPSKAKGSRRHDKTAAAEEEADATP